VDAFLDQLDGSEEVWVTVCSSSRWATRQATDFLPPSPAKDLEAYRRFVDRLVRHCAGRVRYWQCDNEPSNVGLLWAGTAAEYVAQLKVMYRAVKDADPDALVVLGGARSGSRRAHPTAPTGSSSTSCWLTAATPSTCSTCTCTARPAGSRPTSRPHAG
jgi:hypothetical protein